MPQTTSVTASQLQCDLPPELAYCVRSQRSREPPTGRDAEAPITARGEEKHLILDFKDIPHQSMKMSFQGSSVNRHKVMYHQLQAYVRFVCAKQSTRRVHTPPGVFLRQNGSESAWATSRLIVVRKLQYNQGVRNGGELICKQHGFVDFYLDELLGQC